MQTLAGKMLRVRNWDATFENFRTRSMQHTARVSIPNKLDNEGYIELISHADGAAHFGAWIALVGGFGGLRHRDGIVGFAPRLPQALSRLAFTVLIRGRRLHAEVTHADVTYALADGEPLEVLHYDEKVQLSADKPQTRPIRTGSARPRPSQPPGREPIRRRTSADGN